MSDKMMLGNDWVRIVNALDVKSGVLYGASCIVSRLGAFPGIPVVYWFISVDGNMCIVISPMLDKAYRCEGEHVAPLDSLYSALLNGGLVGDVEFKHQSHQTYARLAGAGDE